MKKRILLFEDNHDLRLSLISLLSLEDDFIVVGDFPHCEHIEDLLISLKPDLILMDIDLPVTSGIEGVKRIRAAKSKVLIVMLTVFDDNTSVYDALYAGANGYLLKKHISDRLVNALKDVCEGGAAMSPAIARMVLEHALKKTEVKTAEDYQITPRELDVLTSLGKGNSYKMVAAELLISIDTVRSHIKRIYEKLHVQSQGEAISKALREGLID